jgi:hypothetical protein
VARRSSNTAKKAADLGIRGAPLEPIGMVERELTRPDGTKLVVKVPVYPPFKLDERPERATEIRERKAPSKKKTR